MKKTYLLGIFTMLLSHAFAFDYNTSNPSYDEYNTIYFTETGVSGSNIKSIEIDDVDKYKMTVVFVDDTEYLIQLSNDKEFDLQNTQELEESTTSTNSPGPKGYAAFIKNPKEFKKRFTYSVG